MNDIRGTILNITKNVTKTSSDLLKSTKLGLNLSTEENNLKSLYMEIGRKVHEIYQYGGSLGKFFDEKYLEIETCERKITELKEQIGQIKGTRECPKCGKSVDRAAEFCPKCGLRLDISAFVEPPETTQPTPTQEYYPPPPPMPEPLPAQESVIQTVQNKKICRICNAENENSTKFCLSCGRMLD